MRKHSIPSGHHQQFLLLKQIRGPENLWGLLCLHQQIFSPRAIPHTNSGGTTEYIVDGEKTVTKTDLPQALQIQLTPESRKYTTINTHLSIYQYKRLNYGVNSAVSIFPRTLENVLKDLPGCCVRIDDIHIFQENQMKFT